MKNLKDRYRAALKENELQEAFDELWPTWSSEMAARIYAEVLSVMDLLLLTSVLDNRREIRKLKKEMKKMEEELTSLRNLPLTETRDSALIESTPQSTQQIETKTKG